MALGDRPSLEYSAVTLGPRDSTDSTPATGLGLYLPFSCFRNLASSFVHFRTSGLAALSLWEGWEKENEATVLESGQERDVFDDEFVLSRREGLSPIGIRN